MREEIKRELKRAKSLHMSRVPREARSFFIELADRKFSSDYGMTLNYLVDVYRFWFPKILEYEERISNLEKAVKVNSQTSNKIIRTVGGKTLKIGGDDIE